MRVSVFVRIGSAHSFVFELAVVEGLFEHRIRIDVVFDRVFIVRLEHVAWVAPIQQYLDIAALRHRVIVVGRVAGDWFFLFEPEVVIEFVLHHTDQLSQCHAHVDLLTKLLWFRSAAPVALNALSIIGAASIARSSPRTAGLFIVADNTAAATLCTGSVFVA